MENNKGNQAQTNTELVALIPQQAIETSQQPTITTTIETEAIPLIAISYQDNAIPGTSSDVLNVITDTEPNQKCKITDNEELLSKHDQTVTDITCDISNIQIVATPSNSSSNSCQKCNCNRISNLCDKNNSATTESNSASTNKIHDDDVDGTYNVCLANKNTSDSRKQSIQIVPITPNVPNSSNHLTYLPPHFRNLPKTQSLDLADRDTDMSGLLPKMQSFEQIRPIYPNVPYSPYGSPFGSPRMGRRRPPLRESRRISIEQTGSFLQLNQYKLMDQIGQV